MTEPSHDIAADLDQLRDTSEAVKRDTEQGLRPGILELDQKIQQGVPFGRRSPSGEVDAAARALTYALKRHAHNSVSHLQRAEQIAALLDAIVAAYADTDAVSALNLDLILDQINEVTRLTSALQPPTGAQP